MTVPATPGDLRTTLTASAALTTATLPVFLIGALSTKVGAELGFGEAGVGAAVTVLLGTAGLTATTAGKVTERFGAGLALRVGVLTAGIATASVGLFARSWWHVAIAFTCVGACVGLIDTGAARTFSDRVQPGRQGTAFGLKEASVPAGSLLAGLAVPTIATGFGWRTTFVSAFAIAALVLLTLPRIRTTRVALDTRTSGGPDAVAGRAALVRLAVAVGIGAGTAGAGATFLVPFAADQGSGVGAAGALLSGASLTSVVARILMGRWADRPTARPVTAIVVMLALGGLGALVLAPAGAGVAVIVGAMLVLGAGWGWTGLAFLAAVRARPSAPAAAAGVVLTGLGIGGAVGPFAFGAIVEGASYRAAWAASAGALLVAAALAATVRAPLSPPTRSAGS